MTFCLSVLTSKFSLKFNYTLLLSLCKIRVKMEFCLFYWFGFNFKARFLNVTVENYPII